MLAPTTSTCLPLTLLRSKSSLRTAPLLVVPEPYELTFTNSTRRWSG